MSEPVTRVSLSGHAFSLTELEDFIAHSRRVDGMEHDAYVFVEVDTETGSPYVTLHAQSGD